MKLNCKTLMSTAGLLGAAIVSMAAPLAAQAGPSATMSLTNNYIWRGQSFSNKAPAVQGSLDYATEFGLAAGVWMSNAVTLAGNDMETDLYTSYTHALGDVTLSGSVFYYTYTIDSSSNAVELQASAAYGPVKFEAGYMPEYFAAKTTSTYVKLGVKQPVMEKVSVIGSVGMTSFGDEAKTSTMGGFKNYLDYRAGLSYTNEGYTFEGAYSNTDRKDLTDKKYDDRAVSLTLSRTF